MKHVLKVKYQKTMKQCSVLDISQNVITNYAPISLNNYDCNILVPIPTNWISKNTDKLVHQEQAVYIRK